MEEEKKKRTRGIGVAMLQNKTGPKKKGKGGVKKKPGRKPGLTQASKDRFERIVNAISYGIPSSKIIKDYKPYTPLKLYQATAEEGINTSVFLVQVAKTPALKEKYEAMKLIRRETIATQAEDVIQKALAEKMDIDDKDVARLGLDFLKATDKAYNPKIEIEQNIKRLNLNISDAELIDKIQQLTGM